MDRVDACASSRLALAAGVADASVTVKTLVVKSEDSRILGDMKGLRRHYRQLMDINRDLLVSTR